MTLIIDNRSFALLCAVSHGAIVSMVLPCQCSVCGTKGMMKLASHSGSTVLWKRFASVSSSSLQAEICKIICVIISAAK